MSLDILHRVAKPLRVARWLNRLSRRRWDTDTQFVLVFLGVLVAHLLLAPMLMRSAGEAEPDDPRRYLTGGSSSEAPRTVSGEDAESPGKPGDHLILTDAAITAAGPEEESAAGEAGSDPDAKPAKPSPESPRPRSEGIANAVESAGEGDRGGASPPQLSELIAGAPAVSEENSGAAAADSGEPPASQTGGDSGPEAGPRRFRKLR